MQPLVASMPEVMLVGTLLEHHPEIGPMLDAMERKFCGERAGFAGILSRLAGVVAAFVVRGWVECGCGDATDWVQALRDPRLSPGHCRIAPRAGTQLDCCRTGGADRLSPFGVYATVRCCHRHDAGALFDAIADAPCRPVDRAGSSADRECGLSARVRIACRLQPRLQAHERPAAGCAARAVGKRRLTGSGLFNIPYRLRDTGRTRCAGSSPRSTRAVTPLRRAAGTASTARRAACPVVSVRRIEAAQP